MKRSQQPVSSMPPELRDRLEQIVEAYRAARVKEAHLRKRIKARTDPLRIAMGELIDRYNERLARVTKRRRELSAEFLALWSEHLPGLRRVILPSAAVQKRRDVKVTVHNQREVIDALDRLNRLDLVDEIVNESGLRALARDGKLSGLPEGAVKIEESMTVQVYPREDS